MLVFGFFLCRDLVGRREALSLVKREGLWTLQGAGFGLTVLRLTVTLFPDSSNVFFKRIVFIFKHRQCELGKLLMTIAWHVCF